MRPTPCDPVPHNPSPVLRTPSPPLAERDGASRRGRTVRCAFENPGRLDLSHRGMGCSLSLRERARVRGKAACSCQGLPALAGVELCFRSLRVVDSIGSSPDRWFAERLFPLTP